MLVEKSFDTGEVVLNYAEGPDIGPPVVCLHGLTDRWQYFLPVLPTLSMRWHVYALDFRGHGKSGRASTYRYNDHVLDTIAFLESQVKEKAVFFGSSMGGMISLMVAAKRQDLVKAVIFGDASIKAEHVREVVTNYHSYWDGWKKLPYNEDAYDQRDWNRIRRYQRKRMAKHLIGQFKVQASLLAIKVSDSEIPLLYEYEDKDVSESIERKIITRLLHNAHTKRDEDCYHLIIGDEQESLFMNRAIRLTERGSPFRPNEHGKKIYGDVSFPRGFKWIPNENKLHQTLDLIKGISD